MKTKDVIRAWKDAAFRQSLSEADRAKLPAHPSGMIELTDAELGVVTGGSTANCNTQGGQCRTGIVCSTNNCTNGACTSLCSGACTIVGPGCPM